MAKRNPRQWRLLLLWLWLWLWRIKQNAKCRPWESRISRRDGPSRQPFEGENQSRPTKQLHFALSCHSALSTFAGPKNLNGNLSWFSMLQLGVRPPANSLSSHYVSQSAGLIEPSISPEFGQEPNPGSRARCSDRPVTIRHLPDTQLPVTSWQSPGTWQVSSDRDLTGMGWQTKLMARHFPTFVGETLDLYYYYFFFLASLGRLGFNEALINCAACPFWRRREPRDLWSSTTFPALSLFALRLFRPSRKCLLKYYIWHNWNLCATIRGPKRKSHHVRAANEQKAE